MVLAVSGTAMSGLLFAAPSFVQAQEQDVGADIGAQLNAAGGSKGAGLQYVDPRVTVILLIRSILKVIGLIVFCFIIYAGYLWMTAGGDDEQIEKAKRVIRNSVIGLIIVISSYSITSFAINVAIGQPTNSFIGLFTS